MEGYQSLGEETSERCVVREHLQSARPNSTVKMCIYCSYKYREGWSKLLEYDDIYQEALPDRTTPQSTHGFHDSWDELSEELEL